MLMVVESANSDRPSTGFCIDPLLGGKYAVACLKDYCQNCVQLGLQVLGMLQFQLFDLSSYLR